MMDSLLLMAHRGRISQLSFSKIRLLELNGWDLELEIGFQNMRFFFFLKRCVILRARCSF